MKLMHIINNLTLDVIHRDLLKNNIFNIINVYVIYDIKIYFQYRS